MKLCRKHIILSLLVLGFFSFTTSESNALNHLQYLEYDLEESIDSFDDISDLTKAQDTEASGCGNLLTTFHQITPFKFNRFLEVKSTFYQIALKKVKSHLFILFCCLKLDC